MIQEKIDYSHPKVLEIMAVASKIYGDTMLMEMSRADARKRRPDMKTAIDFVKKFNTNYELGAEEYLPREESQIKTFAIEYLVIGACALVLIVAYIIAWSMRGGGV